MQLPSSPEALKLNTDRVVFAKFSEILGPIRNARPIGMEPLHTVESIEQSILLKPITVVPWIWLKNREFKHLPDECIGAIVSVSLFELLPAHFSDDYVDLVSHMLE